MKEESKITKTFTITTSREVMKRIEHFLALLHFNSIFGHSGLFAMHLDGDGPEKVRVNDLPRELKDQVNAIGGVGYGVEIANENGYSGKFLDRKRESRWYVRPSATLYKDGKVNKVLPSEDYEYDE